MRKQDSVPEIEKADPIQNGEGRAKAFIQRLILAVIGAIAGNLLGLAAVSEIPLFEGEGKTTFLYFVAACMIVGSISATVGGEFILKHLNRSD